MFKYSPLLLSNVFRPVELLGPTLVVPDANELECDSQTSSYHYHRGPIYYQKPATDLTMHRGNYVLALATYPVGCRSGHSHPRVLNKLFRPTKLRDHIGVRFQLGGVRRVLEIHHRDFQGGVLDFQSVPVGGYIDILFLLS